MVAEGPSKVGRAKGMGRKRQDLVGQLKYAVMVVAESGEKPGPGQRPD